MADLNEKPIIVISFSDLKSDPRVRRQLVEFSKTRRVIAIGCNNPELENVEYVHVSVSRSGLACKIKKALLLAPHTYSAYDRFISKKLGEETILRTLSAQPLFLGDKKIAPYAIYCNDLDSLPLGIKVRKMWGGKDGSVPLIFDAHEFSLKEFGSLLWRFFFSGHRKHALVSALPEIDEMITVCDGIADEYRRVLGVRPRVITNATEYRNLRPSETSAPIRMVHHGACMEERGIERMIDLVELLDERFSLDLMLVPTQPRYYTRIRQLVADKPRIRLIDPVPMSDIVKKINGYDIGLYILQPTNFNNMHALPNKFFEFVQARLCIATGPSPEMARLTREYDLGIVSDDFSPDSMAKMLSTLSVVDIQRYKEKSDKTARILSSEYNMRILNDIVQEACEQKCEGQSRFQEACFNENYR